MLIKVNDSDVIGVENGSRFTLGSVVVAPPNADTTAAPTPTVATIAPIATTIGVSNAVAASVVAVEANGKEDMDATSSSSPSSAPSASSASSAAISYHLILAQWIEDTVGEPLAAKDNLWCSLKSGVVLCKLVNKIKPGTIKGFNGTNKSPRSQPLNLHHARDNLFVYLEALKQLGVKQEDLFEVPDASNFAAQQEGDGERRRELLQGILRSVRALQVLAKSQSKSAASPRVAAHEKEVAREVATRCVHHEVAPPIAKVAPIAGVALPNAEVTRHAVHPKAPIITPIVVAAPIRVSAPLMHNVAAAVARLQPQQQKKKREEADGGDDDFTRNQKRALRGAVMLSAIEEEEENDAGDGDDHIDDDINGLRARLTAKEKELEEFQGQLQQIHDLISPLMARKQQAEEELECAIQVCGCELTAKDAELEELRQQLQQRDSALASKEAEIQLLRAAIDEAQAQAQAAIVDEAQAQAIAEHGEGVVDQDISNEKKKGEPFAAVATTTTTATAVANDNNNNNDNDIIADGKVREEYEEEEAILRRADQERACLRQQLAEAREELASAHAELLGVVSAKDSELRELQAQLQQMMIKMVKVDEVEQNKQSRARQEAEELLLRAKDREIQLQDLKLWRAEAAERAAKRELAKSERAREELSEKLAAIFKEEQEQQEEEQQEEEQQEEEQQQQEQEQGQAEVGDGEQDFLLDDDSIFASPPPSPSSLSPSLSSCSLASPSSSSSSLSSSPSSLSSSRSSSPSSLSSSSSPSLSSSRSSSPSLSSSLSSPRSSSPSSAASAELNKEQKKKGKKKRLSSWLKAVVRRGGELADSLTSSTS